MSEANAAEKPKLLIVDDDVDIRQQMEWALCADYQIVQASVFTISTAPRLQPAGVAGDDRPWRVGVSDPARSHGVVALVDATDLAVATSGRAERGEHIWNGSAQAKPEILSFSVIGPAYRSTVETCSDCSTVVATSSTEIRKSELVDETFMP